MNSKLGLFLRCTTNLYNNRSDRPHRLDQADTPQGNKVLTTIGIVDWHIAYRMDTMDNIDHPFCLHRHSTKYILHQYRLRPCHMGDRTQVVLILLVVLNIRLSFSHTIHIRLCMDCLTSYGFVVNIGYASYLHLQVGGNGYHSDGTMQNARLAPIISYP